VTVRYGYPPCWTKADDDAVFVEFTVGGVCGCDGACDDGCPNCTHERRIEWKSARVKAALFPHMEARRV